MVSSGRCFTLVNVTLACVDVEVVVLCVVLAILCFVLVVFASSCWWCVCLVLVLRLVERRAPGEDAGGGLTRAGGVAGPR